MDAGRFDSLTRALARVGSRRLALSGLLTGALGLLGPRPHEAAAKKKKPCPPCKKRKKGKCKAALPDGTVCSGGTCQGGNCIATPTPPPPPPPPTITCATGTELCGSACYPPCPNPFLEVRHPRTCQCCQFRELCGRSGPDPRCCSGECAPFAGENHCRQRNPGEPCDFGAQCLGEDPLVPGTCVNGVCARWSPGTRCSQSSQCASNTCSCVDTTCTCRRSPCSGTNGACNPNDPAGRDVDCCTGSCTGINVGTGQTFCL
jgi:hypothetical protein